MNRLKKCIIAYNNVPEDLKYKPMLLRNKICTKFILTTRIYLFG